MRYTIDQVPMQQDYFNNRPAGLPISLVVIHYTAGRHSGDLNVLSGGTNRRVSVHYLVGRNEDFGIKALVPENRRAWHAGESRWRDHNNNPREDVNDFSIGIEISNMGPPEAFTDFQYDAVVQLAQDIMSRRPEITIDRFVGHNDISAPRKVDPGPLWDWNRFRNLVQNPELKIVSLATAQSMLQAIPCNPQVGNNRVQVDLLPLCAAMNIDPVPNAAALANANHIVVNNVRRVALRAFCEANGWDVLTHRLASESKIYLRPRDLSFNADED
jgi:N-acetyl-anhydromuramyl-L-alanine amidase AmpD